MMSFVIAKNMKRVINEHFDSLNSQKIYKTLDSFYNSMLTVFVTILTSHRKNITGDGITNVRFRNFLEHSSDKFLNSPPTHAFVFAFSVFYSIDYIELTTELSEEEVAKYVKKRMAKGFTIHYDHDRDKPSPTNQTQPHDFETTIKKVQELIFGNDDRYPFLNSERAIKLLIPNGKEFVLDSMNLQLKKALKTGKLENSHKNLQKATLTFFTEGDGICRVKASLTDTQGHEGQLKGFSIILSEGHTESTAWVFLRRTDNNFASFLVLSFRMGEDGWKDRNTRVAQVLNLRAYDTMPILYRMLLYRSGSISESHLDKFVGLVHLGDEESLIEESSFNLTKEYLALKAGRTNEESSINKNHRHYNNIARHFEGIDEEGFNSLFELFERIYGDGQFDKKIMIHAKNSDDVHIPPFGRATIKRENILSGSQLSQLLLSWLRYIDWHPHRNELTTTIDADAEALYKAIKSQ